MKETTKYIIKLLISTSICITIVRLREIEDTFSIVFLSMIIYGMIWMIGEMIRVFRGNLKEIKEWKEKHKEEKKENGGG